MFRIIKLYNKLLYFSYQKLKNNRYPGEKLETSKIFV